MIYFKKVVVWSGVGCIVRCTTSIMSIHIHNSCLGPKNCGDSMKHMDIDQSACYDNDGEASCGINATLFSSVRLLSLSVSVHDGYYFSY